MNKMKKWAITLAPFVFVGCAEQIEVGPNASSGDEVMFTVENNSSGKTRTMYQDNWDEKESQAIYWGNYLDNPENINIYCPNTARGFAEYQVTPDNKNLNVAATVVRVSPIGVQWGDKETPHTFYAFYPADKAKGSLENGNTIEATVDGDQSPQMYKYKINTEKFENLQKIESFEAYNEVEYNKGTPNADYPKTIYGMPDMSAAVMMAKTNMKGKYGEEVPLSFKVLADVLDLTFNGPVSPNSLGGNAIQESRSQIKIQTVTIDVVVPEDLTGITDAAKRQEKISKFEIDNTKSISGSFKLDMAAENVTKIVDGKPTVTLYTSMDGGVPTLFVRKTIGENDTPEVNDLDHLRLRAFLIPGQIATDELEKLRIHIQTDCGDFYQMLRSDSTGGYINGRIYPVKLGYFKQRGQEFDLKKWIGQLDPNIYLSELSIPGAWHAANTMFQGDNSLQAMYDAGIRAFEVHTKVGTDLRQCGNMDNAFDINNEERNFEKPFVFGNSTSYEVKDVTGKSNGNTEYGDHTVNGTLYSYRRSVKATAGTVVETRKTIEYTVPKFWLRLYRTQDTEKKEPLSTALENLYKNMNSDGLIFLEIGEETGDGTMNIPYRSSANCTTTLTKSSVPVSGYEHSNYSDFAYSTTIWDTPDMSGASENREETSTSGAGTLSIKDKQAWMIGVRSCFENLAGKGIVYDKELTRSTTLADVKHRIVTKINTNNEENENLSVWGDNTPGLFSRWMGDSGKKPLTINLKWKAPVSPYTLGTSEPDPSDDALRWCFSELDNFYNWGSSTTIEERKKAIEEMNSIAAGNYAGGLHRTFYETSLGGYLTGSNSASAEGVENVSKELHPYVIDRLSNPTRQNVPLGLVFMNYVIPPTGKEDIYKSKELIRAIINNNQAFRLHRITDGK